MNFVHPLIEKPITINEGEIATIVIENPIELRSTVTGIVNADPDFVLSKNFTPIELSKYAEFITDMFDVDFASKKISSKLSAEAERISMDYANETLSLLQTLNEYAELISNSIDFPVKYSFVENAEKIIKLLNFTIDNENMTFPEALLTYMEVCRGFLGKQLFIFLNLKNFLSDIEFELFCKTAAYEKFRILLIEAFDSGKISEYEKKYIIDNDLCVICSDDL